VSPSRCYSSGRPLATFCHQQQLLELPWYVPASNSSTITLSTNVTCIHCRHNSSPLKPDGIRPYKLQWPMSENLWQQSKPLYAWFSYLWCILVSAKTATACITWD
jgi:hypothetical protein